MKKTQLSLGLALCAILLSACSSGSEEALPTPAGTSSSSSSAVATETAQPTSAPPSESASCATTDAREEVEKALQTIGNPLEGPKVSWAPEKADYSTYDSCADLSWVIVPTSGQEVAEEIEPNRVLLFHHGEYIKSATEHTDLIIPQVTALDKNRVQVVFKSPNGEYTSVYTWNEATQQVDRTGELAPAWGIEGGPAAPSASEAASKAKSGDLAGTVEIPLQKSQAGDGYDGYASFKTPSGNIGCSIQKDGKDGYCGVKSYLSDQKYPVDSYVRGETAYGWTIDLNGSNGYAPRMKQDAPDYEAYSITAEYGKTYTYGNFACDSEEDGLTCWNITTGEGVFMSREGYEVIQR